MFWNSMPSFEPLLEPIDESTEMLLCESFMRLFCNSVGTTECLRCGRATVSNIPTPPAPFQCSIGRSLSLLSIWASRKSPWWWSLFFLLPFGEEAAPGADKFNMAYFFFAAILAFSILVACLKFFVSLLPVVAVYFFLEAKLSDLERDRFGTSAALLSLVWLLTPTPYVSAIIGSSQVFEGPCLYTTGPPARSLLSGGEDVLWLLFV